MRLRPLSVLVLIVILALCRPAARAATILFMVANAAQLTNADPAIVRLLRARDHEVIIYTAPGTTREQQIAAADNVDLVLISESLGSSSVAPDGVFSLKGHEVAVVSFEAYMWDDADWTGRIQYDDFGNTGRPADVGAVHPELAELQDTIYIVEPDHCLAAGLEGAVQVYNRPYSVNFGTPSDDATVIATADEDEIFPTIFAYREGDELFDGSESAGTRVGLFLGQAAEPDAAFGVRWTFLTDEGQALFEAAIDWALDPDASCESGPVFQRGDANADFAVNITDGVFTLGFLFLGTDAPSCAKASDSNDNGAVALDDAVYLFNHLFLGGPDPKAPFPECGVDPSQDGLECAEFAPCEG